MQVITRLSTTSTSTVSYVVLYILYLDPPRHSFQKSHAVWYMFITRPTTTSTSLKYNIRYIMIYYSLKNGFLPLSLMLQNAVQFPNLTATATSALSWCINCARYNKTHLDDCFNRLMMYCTPATSILSWCIVHVLTRLTSTAIWTLSWCIVNRQLQHSHDVLCTL